MNEQALVSLVASSWQAAREKTRFAPAIGVQSDTKWEGPETVSLDGEDFRVVQCDSVLHVREVLESQADGRLIVITPFGVRELGADVEAKLLRHRLLRIEPWDALRSRFNAKSVDSALVGKRALAEAAIESLAIGQPDPAPAGVLTAETVWKLVLSGRLGLAESKPDARTWLEWTLDADRVARWRAVDKDLKELLRDWLAGYLGDWGAAFLGCLESGYGQQAIPIGLAVAVLRQEGPDGQKQILLAQARGRLEQYTGGRPLSAESQRVWAESAEQWAAARCADGDTSEVADQLAQADQLLEKTGALNLAALGSWSPTGFEQRLGAFAGVVGELLENRCSLHAVERCFEELGRHRASKWFPRERTWFDRACMAIRLCRWLATPTQESEDWNSAVLRYTESGAWVDVARQGMLGGDEPESVSRRWNTLSRAVEKRREQENREFAVHLTRAVYDDRVSGPVLPIEDILERAVAPCAKDKVLLVVMDGMSFAVWHEIQADVQGREFVSLTWQEAVTTPTALSTFPSTTGFSRCSLLCGQLASGGQDVEKRGFAENRTLLPVSRAGFPPVLFHKDEVGSGSHDLADVVRAEIQNENRRVVGVVINVIDDSLAGPEQRRFRWTIDQVPILRTLVQAAAQSGRTVVITSDHGHVLDRGASMRRRNAAGDRYRSAEMPVAEDEVLLQGRRVLAPSGQVIALTCENIRYSSVRKLGYHGGVTPQECLVPIAILTPNGRKLDGWREVVDRTPLWWFGETAAAQQPEPKRAKAPREIPTPLFEGVPALPERDWISRLMTSPIFLEQLRVAGGRMEASSIEETIRALATRNGVLMKVALAQKLAMPLLRIDGFLSNLQRVLNVDGYPVVSLDTSQTVRLDFDLLKTQFEVEQS